MDGASFFKTLLQSKSTNAPIQFSGGDEANSFPVAGAEVNIVTSEGDHDLGSSKLKIKNIVNFGWDHKYSHGQVVAVHVTGTYLAYAITTPGKNLGVVRVVNRATDDRILVKGMRGPVKDLSFAHICSEVIVGCVDTLGNLFVHRVTEQASGLASERLLEVLREDGEVGQEHRLIWCPYLPDPPSEEEEEDEEEGTDTSAARLLVLTHGCRAEVWNLDLCVEAHGSGPLAPEDVTQGFLLIPATGGAVIDAAFSPDGTALATATEDGEVKFFQIYLHEEGPPRSLHQWSPHGGQPVSSLYFLDDHSQGSQPDVQFWKFCLTAANMNSELKVWSCETWSCLQTVTIRRPQGDASPVRLKSALDPTASYLLLADIDKWLVYVLSLSQDGGARVVSTSEFATPAPFLSFCCVSAGRRLVKQTTEGVQVEEEGEGVLGGGKERTVVRLYLVQPKSLQECSIIYEDAAARVQPSLPPPSGEVDLSFQEPSTEDQELGHSILGSPPDCQSTPRTLASPPVLPLAASLPPISLTTILPSTASLPLPPISLTSRPASNADQLAEAASKISLLSPDQFKPSPAKVQPDLVTEAREEQEDEPSCSSPPPPVLELVARGESGHSSPSREVAHILSVEEPAYSEQGESQGSPDRTFQEDSLSPSPAPLPQFPAAPAVPLPPQDSGDTRTSLAEVLCSLQAQAREDRQVQAAALDRLERRLEAVLKREQGEGATSRVEAALARHAAAMEAGRKEQTEALLASLSSSLVTRLDQVVTGELKRSLPGVVSRALDGVKTQVEREVATKLRGVEHQLEGGVKEILAKTVGSGQVREALGRSVALAVTESLQAAIQESYRAAFSQQSLGFEQALQVMVRQTGEQFALGTREYEGVVTRRLEAESLGRREELGPVLGSLGQGLQEVREGVAVLGSSVAGLARQLEAGRAGVTAEEVREIVRREVQGLVMQPGSRGGGETPQQDIKAVTMRQTIQAHISNGNIEAAFQGALSANDLGLVVFTCELLNTTQVFNSAQCPLSQEVLLSLIQQLSVDLGDKTEVKHSYLHEALVNLDPNNPTTKTHIKAVLVGLETSLRMYIQANPNSKMTRNMKLLVMACSTNMQ